MKKNNHIIRIWIIVALTIVVLGLFVARLINIQIVESENYKKILSGRTISTQTVKAARGEIVDRNGIPLAVNRMGYDVIFDKAFLPSDNQNSIILTLVSLFEQQSEEWSDTLPITLTAPYTFLADEDSELKIKRLKEYLNIGSYSTAPNALYWLCERYNLQNYSPDEQRKIAGIRYEMELRGFSYNTPYTFATDVDISLVIHIKELSYKMPGVDVAESTVRINPNGILAPHVIGTIGPIYKEQYDGLSEKGYAMDDLLGKSGLELAFEETLRGANGRREIYIDSQGTVVSALESVSPTPGQTIVTTIDTQMQLLLQQSLERQIKNLQANAPEGSGKEADSGAAVVLNMKGEILAIATYPSYDLNSYRQDYSKLASDGTLTPLLNRAVQGGYAPGSTFKPVVATAGIANNIIDKSSTVFCGHVYTFYSGYQPTCLGTHGSVDLLNALRVSCNIFFYDVGRRVGIEEIVKTASQYGLGESTGIEIPEKKGVVSSPAARAADPNNSNPWYGGDVLQSSIGQLYNEFTPLQLANYAATIANRGKRMKVTLVHEIRNYTQDQVIKPFEPIVADVVDAPPEAFESIIEGMVLASGYSGTAYAQFGGYPVSVASKTGTPETSGLPNSTFICFAPADNPQVAIAVVIEKGWHGYTGAPVAKDILDYHFGYKTAEELKALYTTMLETENPSLKTDTTLPDFSSTTQE